MLGNIGGERVIAVLTDEVEGLEIIESSYLILLLRRLGVKHLHCIFESTPLDDTAPTGVVGVKDYFAYSTQRAAIPYSNDATCIHSLGDALVWSWPGPTYPTQAEKKAAQTAGFGYVTIADL